MFGIYSKEDLDVMQSWDLQRKIQVTTTRIIEWYEYFGGSVYVAFSGGKDSTVLLEIVRRMIVLDAVLLAQIIRSTHGFLINIGIHIYLTDGEISYGTTSSTIISGSL